MIPPAHHHSGELCTDPGCRHVDQQVRHVGPCPTDPAIPCPKRLEEVFSEHDADLLDRLGLDL